MTSNRPWVDKRRGKLGEEMSNIVFGEGSGAGFFRSATRSTAAPPTQKGGHFRKELVWTKAKNVRFAPNGDFPNGVQERSTIEGSNEVTSEFRGANQERQEWQKYDPRGFMASHARENHGEGDVDEPSLNVDGKMNQEAGHSSRNRGAHHMTSKFCGENQNGRERREYPEHFTTAGGDTLINNDGASKKEGKRSQEDDHFFGNSGVQQGDSRFCRENPNGREWGKIIEKTKLAGATFNEGGADWCLKMLIWTP